MAQTRVTRVLSSIVTPPFKGLPAVIWIYFVLCFLLQPNSQIISGNFPDPDDYLYLTQSIDLLHGQNWFDLVQHRMNPPYGTPIPFSHVVCVFYAGIIYVLAPLLGTIGAATVTAAFIPLLYFAFFLFAIRWAAQTFVDSSWVRIAPYLALFTSYLIFQFTPGHIDHHGLDAVIGVVAFGAFTRMIETPQTWRWSVLAGFVLALGMITGLETLPILLLLTAYAGIWAVIRGKAAATAGIIFGLTLFLGHVAFLVITIAPAHLFDPDVLNFSIVYVILAGGMAVCFLANWAASLLPWAAPRYIAAGLCAAVTGFMFIRQFPDLQTGPYGAVDPALAALMFDNISEAMPIIRSGGSWTAEFINLVWPCMALISSACFWWKGEKASRWSWGWLTVVLVVLTGLSAFYQIRILILTEALCAIPLAVVFQKGWYRTSQKYEGCKMCAARMGLVLLMGPLPMVLLPALGDGRSFNKGVLMFPNQEDVASPCEKHALTDMLEMPSYYGKKSLVIMNMLNDGSEILFRTSHKVIAAPYDENVEGNIDSLKFFSATDPKEAEKIARKRGVDLVVVCKALAQIYLPPPGSKMEISETGEGNYLTPTLAVKLIKGDVPDWLKPVNFPLFGNMLLFEVRPANADKP